LHVLAKALAGNNEDGNANVDFNNHNADDDEVHDDGGNIDTTVGSIRQVLTAYEVTSVTDQLPCAIIMVDRRTGVS
jgi:hypothetical protein